MDPVIAKMLQLSSAQRRQAKALSAQSQAPRSIVARVSSVAPSIVPLSNLVNKRDKSPLSTSEPTSATLEIRSRSTNLAIGVMVELVDLVGETTTGAVLLAFLVKVAVEDLPIGVAEDAAPRLWTWPSSWCRLDQSKSRMQPLP